MRYAVISAGFLVAAILGVVLTSGARGDAAGAADKAPPADSAKLQADVVALNEKVAALEARILNLEMLVHTMASRPVHVVEPQQPAPSKPRFLLIGEQP